MGGEEAAAAEQTRQKVWKPNKEECVTKEQKMTNQAQTEDLTEETGCALCAPITAHPMR